MTGPHQRGQDASNGVASRLGPRFRRAREVRQLTVRSLARRVQASASFISQIEHGRATPSLARLVALARELGLSMDDLLSRHESNRPAEPGGRIHQTRDGRVRPQSRALDEDFAVEFVTLTYGAGGESCPSHAPEAHDGREFGHVISRQLGVTLGPKSYEVRAGDSISFNSLVTHRLWNVDRTPVHALWILVGYDRHARHARTSPTGPPTSSP